MQVILKQAQIGFVQCTARFLFTTLKHTNEVMHRTNRNYTGMDIFSSMNRSALYIHCLNGAAALLF